ncbi:MAG: sugar nucleotide-binding protein [Symploca sp. SIO2G7]|nr:sugar nucleotide-binding protein [Symploca sp. SIO2G7]
MYRLTKGDAICWYDFAFTICEEAKQFCFPLQGARFVPMKTAKYPTPAKCATYSVPSGKKISAVWGSHLPIRDFQIKKHPISLRSWGSWGSWGSKVS